MAAHDQEHCGTADPAHQNGPIGYLGEIDHLFGVPATTRNWNTITAVASVLEGE